MPLELKAIDNTDSFQHDYNLENIVKIAELRVELIGNNDLKFKLIGDTKFMKSLVNEFNNVINKPINNPNYFAVNDFEEYLADLENKVVIVKILWSFVAELSTNKDPNISTSLNIFEGAVAAMVSFMTYFVEKYIPLMYGHPLKESVAHKLEIIVEYCLDIFVALFNNKNYGSLHDSDGSNKLWKFIISLLIITYNSTVSDLILIKLLKLVPVLLKNVQPGEDLSEILHILLPTLLKRLSKDCKTIYHSNFPSIEFSSESINQLGFKDPNLPNLELNPNVFRTKVNLLLLTDLITCTAQIFSYVKEQDYNICLGAPLNVENVNTDSIILTSDIYLTMLLLVKYENKALNLAALNLVYLALDRLTRLLDQNDTTQDPITKELIFSNYKKLCPKLIDLLSLDDDQFIKPTTLPIFLLSPSRILADLSSQYPLITDELRKTNVDYKIMKSLELQFRSSQKLKYFTVLKHNSKKCSKLVDFTVMSNCVQETSLNSLSDLLLLLSVFTSRKEEYRERITNFKLRNVKHKTQNYSFSQIIFELIDNYRFVLLQIQLIHKILYSKDTVKGFSANELQWFSKNLGIMVTLVDDSSYTNALYLIRSLSRSVALLRTFFVECNSIVSPFDVDPNSSEIARSRYARDKPSAIGGFINNILQILKGNEISTKIIQVFCVSNSMYKTGQSLKKSQMLNKSITLGTIANFVLDFSSFRYNIVNDHGFLKNLSVVYKHSLISSDNPEEFNENEKFQNSTIQLSILQILKNYMYNENQENKKELIEYFPIAMFFDKMVYGIADENTDGSKEIRQLKLRQKIVSFDILRNLTAGSPYFSQYLIDMYENEFVLSGTNAIDNFPMDWTEFLIKNMTDFKLFDLDGQNSSEDILRNDGLLLSRMDNNDYVSLLLAINYIEDHKYTNIEEFKEKLLPKESILNLWKRILMLNVTKDFENKLDLNTKININNNLNSIKLSIVWIIINLTWKNDVFEYNFPESANNSDQSDRYRIYDTIESPTASRNTLARDRIDIDNSDDSENEKSAHGAAGADGNNSDISLGGSNHDASNNAPNNDRNAVDNAPGAAGAKLTTPSQRAKILKNLGFLEVLDSLIDRLADYEKPTRADPQKGYTGQRFDYFMSNDLLEKIKTARYQIFSLESGNTITFKPRQARNSQAMSAANTASNTASTTAPDTASAGAAPDVPPDVNRGGEGYGYGSDDEYANAPDLSITESHDEDMENAEEDDESVDEVWIQ